ncbi:MAG: GAF domain-containing protein [Deltaproteobacteria bacterium]|nr:GAF domain-containing protein [Deltaproteobacteria bacterium]
MEDPKDTARNERPEELLAARREFLQIFKRGAEFTEELLKENERLRFRVAELELRLNPPSRDDDLVRELLEKVQRLESERQEALLRFQEVEAENKDFASRYVEIENENNNLLNIYVASYQLHSTLDFQEVVQIIVEIVLNFVGAEKFCIGLIDEKTNELRSLVAEGIQREQFNALSTSEGIVGKVVTSGEPHFVSDVESDLEKIDIGNPKVCIPLKIKDRVLGVILIYAFLSQKKRLAHVDYELFTLLAGHAATAIFSAKLYTESKRKLNTIQGLIDLVTS